MEKTLSRVLDDRRLAKKERHEYIVFPLFNNSISIDNFFY